MKKPANKKKAKKKNRQVAALPFRKSGKHREVLLITSRETRRWVIPKGWPMKGKKDWDAAAREAFEEAGIEGVVSNKSLGSYYYDKRLARGSANLKVEVYLLEVAALLEDWPEKGQRTRRWMPAKKAAKLVQEDGLRAIIEAVLT